MTKAKVSGLDCPKCSNDKIITTDRWGVFHIKFLIGVAHLECENCGFVED